MWFMNKIANPLVRLILRSPFHGIMSTALLLITYHGRKSGKEYTLPVQYVQDNQVVYIISGEPEQKTWWRNLRGGAPVQVLLQGQQLQAYADVLDGNAHSTIKSEAFKLFLQRFPASARLHSVRINADGTLDAEDLGRAAASVLLVRVQLKERVSATQPQKNPRQP